MKKRWVLDIGFKRRGLIDLFTLAIISTRRINRFGLSWVLFNIFYCLIKNRVWFCIIMMFVLLKQTNKQTNKKHVQKKKPFLALSFCFLIQMSLQYFGCCMFHNFILFMLSESVVNSYCSLMPQ